MPRGQPFTALCQQVARLAQPRAADLHVHTTASDGEYTPSQVAALARRAGLAAVAVTDHDTLAGVAAAAGGVTVIPGVELTAEFAGRELHILGYFVRPDDAALNVHLAAVCDRRRERFRAFVAALAGRGVAFPAGLAEAEMAKSASLGRRHLAGLLLRTGFVRTRFEAFRRFLDPLTEAVPADHRTPAADALRLARAAGGVTSLAHPPPDLGGAALGELRDLGLQAVEVTFPAATAGRSAELRRLADRLGLAVTGGSDCHGPDPAGRAVGSRGVTRAELDALQRLAGSLA